MLVLWSCPRCLRTYSSTLRDGENRLHCALCKWVWYLRMTCYEETREPGTKIVQNGLETKIVPVETGDIPYEQ